MATRYAFVDETDGLNPAVLVEENVIWEHGSEDHSVDYTNSPNITLTENINDTYMTANDENDTQYFSVLDSSDNEVILNNTLENDKDDGDNTPNLLMGNDNICDENTVDIAGQQVVLFKVGDTEELYGIQLAQDEEGNIQKYQFKIRHNEEGNLEAVPETIQILPIDTEVPIIEAADDISNDDATDANDTIVNEQIFIKQELSTDPLTTYSDENIDEEENINLYQDTNELHGFGENSYQEDNNLPEYEEERNVDNNHMEEANFPYQDVALDEPIDCKRDILEQLSIANKDIFKPNMNNEPANQLEFANERDDDKTPNQSLTIQSKIEVTECFQNDYNEHILPHEHAKELGIQNRYEHLFKKELVVPDASGDNNNSEAEHIETTVDLDHIFAEDECENSQESQQSGFIQTPINENDSDNEDYQIVEGLHVTGDADVSETFAAYDNTINSITYEESNKSLPLQTHVLKLQQQTHPNRKLLNIKNIKIKKVINSMDSKIKENTYFVTKHPEKENLEEVAGLKTSFIRTINPRSLLKSSHPSFVEPKETKSEEKFEKRFAKSKEAIQARQFHNFIAQTKIIHAPVRNERLPRKQTIKPVNRTDEEIIVQEVVVSSNGYIETSEDGVVLERIPLKPTEFIQLSDSDDDYDPKKIIKRKKKSKKRKSIVEITISDSDEDDVSDYETINLDSDNQDSESESSNNQQSRKTRDSEMSKSPDHSDGKESPSPDPSEVKEKRKRGRPPKTKISPSSVETNKIDSDGMSALKASLEQVTVDLDKKLEIQCQKCTKTFPSHGSLKTHMQFHTFKEANKKNIAINKTMNSFQYKYKCSECEETFKNNILLIRHLDSHKNSMKFICTLCKKAFSNNGDLMTHKRSHQKNQMCLSTTVQKISPSKIKPRVSTLPKTNFTCTHCRATFSTKTLLDTHLSKHKQFTCTRCSATFLSKILLDTHVRESCVKSPRKSRQSVLKRKSFGTPPRFVTRKSTLSGNIPQVVKERVVKLPVAKSIKCDKCSMCFSTHTNLFKHKVMAHGLETPDKNINKRLRKSDINIHGGVPASEKFKNAFAALKRKLEN